MAKPIVWTIAGSDSGGGAGIQADLHTFADFNVYGCTAITALTAQNSIAVEDIQYTTKQNFFKQLHALESDLPANIIKIGMIGNRENIDVIHSFLTLHKKTIVYDPVMVATSGMCLMEATEISYIVENIFPLVDLLTPNRQEVNILLETDIQTLDDIEYAAKQLLTFGSKQILIKGGHGDNDFCYDYYTDGNESFWLSTQRIKHMHSHGAGCSLSAAITALLALGYNIKDALVIAKMYVTQGIRLAESIGQGSGSVVHAGWPMQQQDFPCLTKTQPVKKRDKRFLDCGDKPLGLYPIVDSFAWIKRLVNAGVTTLQLRIKDQDNAWIEQQIQLSVELCRQHQVRLFINDYWQLALQYQAYGVHLGQSDLDHVDMDALYQVGIRLGISTHCYYEVARAHTYKPSYIAIGPIFHTDSKPMAFMPQGIEQLKRWCSILSDYRLVAIGGINNDNLTEVIATNVDGIAVISAITKSEDPEKTVREWGRKIQRTPFSDRYFDESLRNESQ